MRDEPERAASAGPATGVETRGEATVGGLVVSPLLTCHKRTKTNTTEQQFLSLRESRRLHAENSDTYLCKI